MTTIIKEIPYGDADQNDNKMMENFISKVESTFQPQEIKDITFTLYKNIYPLQAVIHFNEEMHYTRYNLYNSGLEVHNTGYNCSSEILEKSKEHIIKDSTL